MIDHFCPHLQEHHKPSKPQHPSRKAGKSTSKVITVIRSSKSYLNQTLRCPSFSLQSRNHINRVRVIEGTDMNQTLLICQSSSCILIRSRTRFELISINEEIITANERTFSCVTIPDSYSSLPSLIMVPPLLHQFN